MRLVAIDYAGAAPGLAPDPLLHVSTPWRDIYIWGEDGTLAAARREGAEGAFFSSGPLRRCRDGESPVAGSAAPDCLVAAPDPAALFTK